MNNQPWAIALQKAAILEQHFKAGCEELDLAREWAKRWAELEMEEAAKFQAIAFFGILEIVS